MVNDFKKVYWKIKKTAKIVKYREVFAENIGKTVQKIAKNKPKKYTSLGNWNKFGGVWIDKCTKTHKHEIIII